MPKFERILFPVDFSDRCRGASHYAVALAGRFGSELILLHVVETPITRPGELDFGALAFEADLDARTAQARQMLESFLEPGSGYLNIRKEVQQGDPARAVVRYAHENSVDLIMMPTHGYGVFRRFILGSVTAKVLHDADCAVWTGVHLESAPPLEEIQYRRILCAVDLTPAAEKPLRAAAEFAEEFGAELIVVHAVPSGEAMPERYMDNELRHHLVRDARERLNERLLAMSIEAKEVHIEGGEAARAVHNAALQHRSDLVVIGRGAHGGRGRLRTHSYSIIRESPCPVLSI